MAQVAIITGAGTGIGKAIALELAARGYGLTLVGRTRTTLEQVKKEIGGDSALVISGDVGQFATARRMVEATVERFGGVDVLVNNAGVAKSQAIERTDEQLVQETFATNVFGPAYLIASVWPHFQRAKKGCVINVSSLSARDPFAHLLAYAASKSALESFARSMRAERGEMALRVFNVRPGAVETALLRRLYSEREQPARFALAPEQVAEKVVQCIEGVISDDADPIEITA